VVEWSPLPLFLLLVTILVIMASQQHGGVLETTLPEVDVAGYEQIQTRLVSRHKQVLQVQVAAVGVSGVLLALDYFRPEPGVPWYLVAAAFVVAANAIALALLGRVK
jgi:hypothetical protein